MPPSRTSWPAAWRRSRVCAIACTIWANITATDARVAFFYASRRTDYVLNGLTVAASWARFLSEPWQAVEWLDSHDSDHNQAAAEVLAWFMSDLPAAAGPGKVKNVKNSPPGM